MQQTRYRTICAVSEGLYKEKGSKFLAYAYPLNSEHEVKQYVAELKKEHHTARHHCWAYRIGVEGALYRAFDDGEPSNSAGKPILGQIDAFSLTNILVVVVRYFGGTLLGVGGLMHAYKESTKNCLQHVQIIEKEITREFILQFPYELNNTVNHIIKQSKAEVLSQAYAESCKLDCSIPLEYVDFFTNQIQAFVSIQISQRI